MIQLIATQSLSLQHHWLALKMAEEPELRNSDANLLPYDPDAFDSMAVINSELWDEGNEDENEPFTIDSNVLNSGTNGGSLFLKAAQTGSLGAVKTMLQRFGQELLKYKDDDGYTALHRASYNGHVEVVEHLLSAGSDVHSPTNDGWQPLHCACKWNKVKVASLLLQNGVNVNAQTNGGQTALHLASTNKKGMATLELLLHRHDIDATLKNAADETAYEVAARYGPHSYLFEIVDQSLRTI